MNKKQYNVEVLVNGRKAQEFQKDGMTFVRGDEGTQYQIRVTNNSNRRILARITVDGRSVLTDDKDDESGYIINANDSLKLKGFRLSDDEVSAFVFSKKGDSRAQKRFGYAKDCGVIGVQIQRELDIYNNLQDALKNIKPQPIHPTPYPSYPHWYNINGDGPVFGGKITSGEHSLLDNTIQCCSASSNNATYSASVEPDLDSGAFDMGTSMGDNIKAPVDRVDFETEGRVDATFELYYASYNSLKRNNILQKPKAKAYIPKPNYCKKV